jgi:hypothetical protein
MKGSGAMKVVSVNIGRAVAGEPIGTRIVPAR